MAVEISQTNDDTIWVNSKVVRKDMNNHWVANRELTPSERDAFDSHLRSIGEM
ncbi:hypothetical protein [Maribacter sp. 4U21]|uniref:hypothetical protein n=1 Tax=Maribacter sp. 4U21 TaxID=1889779 RepID=UPI0015D46FDD|nr:hypothetical protein [Maribacter sp. 4U21]